MRYRKTLLLILATSLAGCAGMSRNECELADWHAIGYEHGAFGKSPAAFGTMRQACARHGVAPDFKTYQAGRQAGLEEYCTPERGYHEGRRGAKYFGVCPSHLNGDFLAAYNDGRTRWQLNSNVQSTASEISRCEARIDAIEHQLVGVGADILKPTTTMEERAQLLVESTHLSEERTDLTVRLVDLARELEAHQLALADYENQYASRR